MDESLIDAYFQSTRLHSTDSLLDPRWNGNACSLRYLYGPQQKHAHGITANSSEPSKRIYAKTKCDVPYKSNNAITNNHYDPRVTEAPVTKVVDLYAEENKLMKTRDTRLQLQQASNVIKQLEDLRRKKRDRILNIKRMTLGKECLVKQDLKDPISDDDCINVCPRVGQVDNLTTTKMLQLQDIVSEVSKSMEVYSNLQCKNDSPENSDKTQSREFAIKPIETTKLDSSEERLTTMKVDSMVPNLAKSVKEGQKLSRTMGEGKKFAEGEVNRLQLMKTADINYTYRKNEKDIGLYNFITPEIENFNSDKSYLIDASKNGQKVGHYSGNACSDSEEPIMCSLDQIDTKRAWMELQVRKDNAREMQEQKTLEESNRLDVFDLNKSGSESKDLPSYSHKVVKACQKCKRIALELQETQIRARSLQVESETQALKIDTIQHLIFDLQRQTDEIKVKVSDGVDKQEKLKQENRELLQRLKEVESIVEKEAEIALLKEKVLKLEESHVQLEVSLNEVEKEMKGLKVSNEIMDKKKDNIQDGRNAINDFLAWHVGGYATGMNEIAADSKVARLCGEEAFSTNEVNETGHESKGNGCIKLQFAESEENSLKIKEIAEYFQENNSALYTLCKVSDDILISNDEEMTILETCKLQLENVREKNGEKGETFAPMVEGKGKCKLAMVLSEENILFQRKELKDIAGFLIITAKQSNEEVNNIKESQVTTESYRQHENQIGRRQRDDNITKAKLDEDGEKTVLSDMGDALVKRPYNGELHEALMLETNTPILQNMGKHDWTENNSKEDGSDKQTCDDLEDPEDNMTIDDAFFDMEVGILPDTTVSNDTKEEEVYPEISSDDFNNSLKDSDNYDTKENKGHTEIIFPLSPLAVHPSNGLYTDSVSMLGSLPPLPGNSEIMKNQVLQNKVVKKRNAKKEKNNDNFLTKYLMPSSKCHAEMIDIQMVHDGGDEGESTSADVDDLPRDEK